MLHNYSVHTSVQFISSGPKQIRCISDKFSPADFEGHSDTPKSEMKKTKSDRRRYYQKLGSTKFGVNLPGLGYDCFRLWELLTMGTIVVMERGVGLDRSVSKFIHYSLVPSYFITWPISIVYNHEINHFFILIEFNSFIFFLIMSSLFSLPSMSNRAK
jgi:hypothetical protein